MEKFTIAVLLSMLLVFVGCKDDSVNDPAPTGNGTLTLRLTDAPADVEALHVTFSEFSVAINNEWVTLSDSTRTIDLRQYGNGEALTIATRDVPAGALDRIRFSVDAAEAVIDGQSVAVTVPAAVRAGVVIDYAMTVGADAQYDLVMDFDVSRSLVAAGGAWRLQPAVRAVQLAESGAIYGVVGNYENLAVAYGITGSDTVTGSFVDAGTGQFMLAFLPAGTYQISIYDSEGRAYHQTSLEVTAGNDLDLGIVNLAESTSAPVCGNGICEYWDGENAQNCPVDCGNVDPTAHFESERLRPGVVGSVSWRTQAEIDRDASGSNDPGDPAYPSYDPNHDAARIPIIAEEPMTQLRYHFPHVSGSVWAQYEMKLGPTFFTAPFDPHGMKLWRAQDDTKAECNDERRITMNVGFDTAPHVYHRDGCAIPDREVRVMTPDGWDEQPGGETRAIWGMNEPHPIAFRWAPDTWVRLTYHFDFANDMLHIWAMRYDDGVTRKIVEFACPDWNAGFGMDVAGPWMHSTSRTHGHWDPNMPTAYIFARNQIISTQPINF